MCCVIVGHPIDCVKVRMQTMVVKPGETPPFTGTFDCLRKTAAKEGVSSHGSRETQDSDIASGNFYTFDICGHTLL